MTKIIDKSFDFYAEAVQYLLKKRRLQKKWLAENIKKKGADTLNMQQTMSRWFNSDPDKRNEISETYRKRIEVLFDVSIINTRNGKYEIHQGEHKKSESTNINYEEMPIDRLERELYDRIESEGVPWNAMGLLLEALEDEASKLQKDMKGLTERIRKIRILNRKKHSDD